MDLTRVPLSYCTVLVDPNLEVILMLCSIQDPAINIAELKDIHSEINLTVPDPILLPNLHDGLEAVRIHLNGTASPGRLQGESEILPLLLFLQQNAKKRKLEDGGEEDLGECLNSHLRCGASSRLWI